MKKRYKYVEIIDELIDQTNIFIGQRWTNNDA